MVVTKVNIVVNEGMTGFWIPIPYINVGIKPFDKGRVPWGSPPGRPSVARGTFGPTPCLDVCIVHFLQMSTPLQNKTHKNFWFNSIYNRLKCLHLCKIKPIRDKIEK